jgi:AcrR family transcriptional regulator
MPSADAAVTPLSWTPNQQAARARIAAAAAAVVARNGIAGCTVRAVADEAGMTKSTVHYYLRDANELVDLAVLGFLDALADHAARLIAEAPDGREALHALVRIFTAGEAPAIALTDPTLWSDFATHAWRRGALDELAHRHITTTSVLVIEGEQHLDEMLPGGERGPHKVRKAGEYHLTTGDAHPHMERGGPDGALIFYSHHTTDGRLYELVDEDGKVIHVVTLDDMVRSWESGA